MIPYVYYPQIDLDIDALQRIALHVDGHQYDPNIDLRYLYADVYRPRGDGLLNYQRPVNEHSYLRDTQKQIPILGDVFNIYIFKPYEIVETHIDSNRLAAFNLPIINTVESVTSFHNKPSYHKEHDGRRTLDVVEDGIELFSFNMDRPLVFNTTIPHRVNNYQSKFRVSLSWGFNCSFEEAVEFFESMRVL